MPQVPSDWSCRLVKLVRCITGGLTLLLGLSTLASSESGFAFSREAEVTTEDPAQSDATPTFVPTGPSRLLDTRAGQPTIDGQNPSGPAALAKSVVAPLGVDGSVDLYNAAGQVDLIVDVGGWFQTGGAVGHPLGRSGYRACRCGRHTWHKQRNEPRFDGARYTDRPAGCGSRGRRSFHDETRGWPNV